MLKKIIGSVLVISALMVGLVAFAQNTPAGANQPTTLACVASAVAAREAAIQSAFGTFSTTMTSAFTKRASDLATAWTITDKTTRNTAIKIAHTTFRASKIEARKTYNTARQTAWQQFSAARKACKAPATGEDNSVDAL